MQTIARCVRNPIAATIAFVLINSLWVLSIGNFVGPQIGGIFGSVTSERPLLSFEKLECPFLVNRDGQGAIVATVKNPYNEVHQYTVHFDTATYQPGDYQESSTCTQPLSVPPQQTAKVSCTVNQPEVKTDSFMVIVEAYPVGDPAEETTLFENLSSSYRGSCIIQSSRLPPSPAQTRALLGSVGALVVLGWTFATWKYLGIISRVVVIIVGPLTWSIIALFLAIVNVYPAILFLLMIAVVIASTLWIARHLQKKQIEIIHP